MVAGHQSQLVVLTIKPLAQSRVDGKPVARGDFKLVEQVPSDQEVVTISLVKKVAELLEGVVSECFAAGRGDTRLSCNSEVEV